MKNIVAYLIVLLVGILHAVAQRKSAIAEKPVLPIDSETKRVTYEEVIEMAGISKEELFLRAKEWFNTYYLNATSVMREENAVAGRLHGKHKFRIYDINEKDSSKTQAGLINYSIYIFVREGQYKYRITQFEQHATTPVPIERWLEDKPESLPAGRRETYYLYLQQTDEFAQDLIKAIKEGMQKKKAVKKIDEW